MSKVEKLNRKWPQRNKQIPHNRKLVIMFCRFLFIFRHIKRSCVSPSFRIVSKPILVKRTISTHQALPPTYISCPSGLSLSSAASLESVLVESLLQYTHVWQLKHNHKNIDNINEFNLNLGQRNKNNCALYKNLILFVECQTRIQ